MRINKMSAFREASDSGDGFKNDSPSKISYDVGEEHSKFVAGDSSPAKDILEDYHITEKEGIKKHTYGEGVNAAQVVCFLDKNGTPLEEITKEVNYIFGENWSEEEVQEVIVEAKQIDIYDFLADSIEVEGDGA